MIWWQIMKYYLSIETIYKSQKDNKKWNYPKQVLRQVVRRNRTKASSSSSSSPTICRLALTCSPFYNWPSIITVPKHSSRPMFKSYRTFKRPTRCSLSKGNNSMARWSYFPQESFCFPLWLDCFSTVSSSFSDSFGVLYSPSMI